MDPLERHAHVEQLVSDAPLRGDEGMDPRTALSKAREVFEGIRLREGQLVAVKPRPQYAPLFAYSIWRYNVVGGDKSS